MELVNELLEGVTEVQSENRSPKIPVKQCIQETAPTTHYNLISGNHESKKRADGGV